MRRKTKSGLVFSGANLSMQVSCAGSDRVLALKVLDQDWFDQAPDTPQNTSWTMRVLSKLNAAAGPGVMDRPVFPVSTEAPAPALTDTDLSGLATGVYDRLFLGAPHKPSELLAASRKPVSKPSVQILSIDPVMPDSYATPDYPPIARVAHLEGTVTLTLAVEQGGRPGKIAFVSGIPILRFAVENSVKHWQFPDSAIGKEISVSIAFNLNCSGAKSP
jgi:protein TonB